MTTKDFIEELFIKVDDEVDDDKHPQTSLYPSEVVTLAMLYVLKGCGQLRYWRWLTKNYSLNFVQ
jgi:hypothetical protein